MIGVIADDITGAAEIGAVGWRRGLRAEIIGPACPVRQMDLVCIDTDSRSVAPDEAGRRASSAAAALRRSGARWIYKKVDSVLRGHVVVEVNAILGQLAVRSALLVPANPGRGRVIRKGCYFVGDRLLPETEFGRDPEYPCRSAAVVDLLGASDAAGIQVGEVGMRQLPDGIVVGEAGSAGDLRQWAGCRAPTVLLGGAAEFFEALLESQSAGTGTSCLADVRATASGSRLFVCGTVSESASRFVEEARQGGTPVFTLPGPSGCGGGMDPAAEREWIRRAVDALRTQSCALLKTSSTMVSGAGGIHGMAKQLARLAVAITQEASVSEVYAEGGATAAQFLRGLEAERLEVVREVAPGVVTLAVGGGAPLRITLKPGSYVWPEEVRRKARCGN